MVTKGDGSCQNQSKRYPSRTLPILLTCAPSPLLCADRCQQPQWDSQLQFSPNQNFYRVGEEVTLSCFLDDTPPIAVIRCAHRTSPHWNNAWEVLEIGGTWRRLSQNLTYTMSKFGTSRSPLLHALLAVEGTWTCCHICETPWAQLRVRSQLRALSKMERVRSLGEERCHPSRDGNAELSQAEIELCSQGVWLHMAVSGEMGRER